MGQTNKARTCENGLGEWSCFCFIGPFVRSVCPFVVSEDDFRHLRVFSEGVDTKVHCNTKTKNKQIYK